MSVHERCRAVCVEVRLRTLHLTRQLELSTDLLCVLKQGHVGGVPVEATMVGGQVLGERATGRQRGEAAPGADGEVIIGQGGRGGRIKAARGADLQGQHAEDGEGSWQVGAGGMLQGVTK